MLVPFLITALIEPVFLLVLMGLTAQMLAYLGPSVNALNSYNYGGGGFGSGGLGSGGLGSGGFGGSGSGGSQSSRGGGGVSRPISDDLSSIFADLSTYDFSSISRGIDSALSGVTTIGQGGGGVLGPGYSSFDFDDFTAFSIPTSLALGTFAARDHAVDKRFAQPAPTGLVSRDASADKKLAKRSPSPTPVPAPTMQRRREHLVKRVSLPTSLSEARSIIRACLAFYALLFIAVWIRLIMLAVYLTLAITRRKRDQDQYERVSKAHSSAAFANGSSQPEPLSVQQSRFGSPQTRRLLHSFFVASCAMAAIIFVFGIVTFALQGARLGLGGVAAAAVAFWVISFLLCALTAFFLRRFYTSLGSLREDEYAKEGQYAQQSGYVQPEQPREMQQAPQAPYVQPSVAPQEVHQPAVHAAVPPPVQATEQAPAPVAEQVNTQAPAPAPEQAAAPATTEAAPQPATPIQALPNQITEGTMFMAVSDGQGGMVMKPVAPAQ